MTKYEDFKHAKIQTWVLKVSIHDCKKCYKKVERVLHSIDGVDNFIIDAGKQKLTVTGNVHSEMLLNELRKSFENAELWPVAQNKEPETPKQQEGQKSGKDDSGDAIEHAAVAKKGNDNGYNENSGGGNECSGGEGASDTIAIIVCVVGRFLSEFLFAILGILLLALSDCVFTIFGSRHEDHEQVEEDTLFSGRQREFGMDTLAAATNNFDSANKLGQGGFGPVYKGITPNGQQIAVKKLSSTSNQGRREFLNEVKLLANIQHRNFVKLLGCCAEGSERLLVYEYLRNGSLDKFLSGESITLNYIA